MANVGTTGTRRNVRALLRRHMPVTERWGYFDHAAVSPIPRNASQIMTRWCEDVANEGDNHWKNWSDRCEELRTRAAKLINANDDEIALIPNTSYGINIVANGLRWKSGDSVVVLDNEFPSNFLPWVQLERLGVEVRKVHVAESGVIDLDAIREAIDSTTRIVSVSWVGYASGFRVDLAKLCEIVHEKNAQLFVDAIQGLGVFPLDVSSIPIDYMSADGHKWLLGPEGAGLFFIRKANLDLIEPLFVGWNSVVSPSNFKTEESRLKPNAARFETGTANQVGLVGLNESLKLLMDHGAGPSSNTLADLVLECADTIEEQVLQLGGSVWRPFHLGERHATQSGILSISFPNVSPQDLKEQIRMEGALTSIRQGCLRVAAHAYNNQDDIDRLIEGIRQAITRKRD